MKGKLVKILYITNIKQCFQSADVRNNTKDFINCLKKEGFEYKYDMRSNGKKGCFVNTYQIQ